MDKILLKKLLIKKIENSSKIKYKLLSEYEKILSISKIIFKTFKKGNKILICGNGGSAADAQHLAAEFLIRFDKKYKRKGLPAISLAMDTSTLTACLNDFSSDLIFSRPFKALAKNGDILICISTSGNSKNILNVLDTSKKMNIMSISLLGSDGGKANKKSNLSIIVPSKNVAEIQETQIFLIHLIIETVEELLRK